MGTVTGRRPPYWAGREQAFQEVLHGANRAALEYLQAWAGIILGRSWLDWVARR